MDPDVWYTFIVVKKAHLDALERDFAQWIKTRQDIERGPFRGLSPEADITSAFCTRIVFLAGHEFRTDFNRFLTSSSMEMFRGPGCG